MYSRPGIWAYLTQLALPIKESPGQDIAGSGLDPQLWRFGSLHSARVSVSTSTVLSRFWL